MPYRFVFRSAAEREFDNLPRAVKERVRDRLDALAIDPRPPGTIALQGRPGLLRARVGDYRILYQVQDNAGIVLVERIAHRREASRR